MSCPLSGKNCTKYKAFHITEKVGEEVKNYSICEDCLHTHIQKTDVVNDITCSKCGTTAESVLKGGRLGCADCYDELSEILSYMIPVIQNGPKDIKHTGSVPNAWLIKESEEESPIKFATELAYKLKAASRDEKYEKAALLKNKLEQFSVLLLRLQKANDQRVPKIKKALADFIYEFRKEEST